MNTRTILYLLALCLSITSCAFIPTIDKDQSYASRCDMITKKMTLTTVVLDNANCSGQNQEACLVALVVGVPAVSLVVSGSVVVVGNTIHWVEYQGTCDSGYVSEYVKVFKEKLKRT